MVARAETIWPFLVPAMWSVPFGSQATEGDQAQSLNHGGSMLSDGVFLHFRLEDFFLSFSNCKLVLLGF